MFEQWRPVADWGGYYEGYYEVSDLGRVRRVHSGRVLRPGLSAGYLRVALCRDGQPRPASVHRLVLAAFAGPCPAGHEANHINGDKGDNRAVNLEWVTASRNQRHARALGLAHGIPPHLQGAAHGRAKLTEADVLAIRAARGSVRPVDLARKYGVARPTIYNAQRGRTWAHVAALSQLSGPGLAPNAEPPSRPRS